MSPSEDSPIEVPLEKWAEQLAERAAWTVINRHVAECPIRGLEKRVGVLEGRFNLVLGAIVGSGALGGTVGAVILKMFGG